MWVSCGLCDGMFVCYIIICAYLPISPNVPQAIEPQQYDNNPYKDPDRRLFRCCWSMARIWLLEILMDALFLMLRRM